MARLVDAEDRCVQGVAVGGGLGAIEQSRQRAVLSGAVDAPRPAVEQTLGGLDDPLDRVAERAVELVPRRRLAGTAAEPAADPVPLVRETLAAPRGNLLVGEPPYGRVVALGGDRHDPRETDCFDPVDRCAELRVESPELGAEPGQVIDHATLVALERLELDRLLVRHHRAQLAHEVAGVGAQPLEFGGDVVEVSDELARPRVAALGLDRQCDQGVE